MKGDVYDGGVVNDGVDGFEVILGWNLVSDGDLQTRRSCNREDSYLYHSNDELYSLAPYYRRLLVLVP